jgi:CRP/FNR family transcriptional regulator, cyclic AMP receptor protein
MVRLLHRQRAMSNRFIAHLLSLARYGKEDNPIRTIPRMSQQTLAEIVGTTRSRVNFFLNKFKKLGFIEYDGKHPLKVNKSLLSVVLHD